MKNKTTIYTLYGLDTIQGVLLSTKELTKDQCQTDWHLDEVFPGYRVQIRWEYTLDEMLDYIVKEYYTFQPGEREWYKEKIESYLNQGIEDLILNRPSGSVVYLNEPLEDSDFRLYQKMTGLSKKELIGKIEEGKKIGITQIVVPNLRTLSVEPFNRDEVIKSLNGELFGLKKLEYIQDCRAKGIDRI